MTPSPLQCGHNILKLPHMLRRRTDGRAGHSNMLIPRRRAAGRCRRHRMIWIRLLWPRFHPSERARILGIFFTISGNGSDVGDERLVFYFPPLFGCCYCCRRQGGRRGTLQLSTETSKVMFIPTSQLLRNAIETRHRVTPHIKI